MVRITVIVASKDREEDLARCLSGLAESAHELDPCVGRLVEAVVVDDGSSSPYPDALPVTVGAPVRVLRNEIAVGASRSRDIAAAQARGEVLAFLDDDAVPRGDWLTVIAENMRDGAVAITGRVLPFDLGLLSRARQARYDLRYANLSPGDPVDFFAGGNSAVKTDDFTGAGGFGSTGSGSDNALVDKLRERAHEVRFEPSLVIAHRNGKGWGPAITAAWGAGRTAGRSGDRRRILGRIRSSYVGADPLVRMANTALGTVHALGAAFARSGPGTSPVTNGTDHRTQHRTGDAHGLATTPLQHS